MNELIISSRHKKDPASCASLEKNMGLHPIIAGLLVQRGITTPEQARAYLHPDFHSLTDPFTLKGMKASVRRVYHALRNQEKIMIFGDFDADGVTATTLLYEFLQICGANITWYIPHRIEEGYGFQVFHVPMAARENIDLIITVDCGISSVEAVDMAGKEDIDVIITDHHEPGSSLPQAFAVIDPKQKDCPSGLDYLAGVGIAFFMAMALRKYFRDKGLWQEIPEPSLLRFLDLFAMGTIADMVPLIRENRVLCQAGLRQISRHPRPGLRALMKVCRLDPSRLDFEDLSFRMIPRINAAGRLSHARICVSLLLHPNLSDAFSIADVLDELNRRRQVIEREMVESIQRKIQSEPGLLHERLLMLWEKGWHPSVLGIAASRLAREYARPVVLLSRKDKTITGSCRSVNQIDIHRALSANAHLLDHFGGHAHAAGLTLSLDNFEPLLESLKNHFDSHYTQEDFLPKLIVDAELSFSDITGSFARELDQLKPFGMENPEPLFLLRDAKVASSHILGGSHRKMTLQNTKGSLVRPIEAFHFNVQNIDHLPMVFDEMVCRVKINKFKPSEVQLTVESV